MTYFGTYGEVPNMGLRESVNALLDRVAYTGWNFGYLAPAWAEANYRDMLEWYAPILDKHEGQLRLKPRITDSAMLAQMIEELVTAANESPIICDQTFGEVEHERQLECVAEILRETGEKRVTSEEVLRAAYEVCDCLPEEDGSGEYGFYWLNDDYERALNAALEAKERAA